jgi:hypothetical protein
LNTAEQLPLEMRNLAGEASARPVLAGLRDTLKATLSETNYPGGRR